MTEQNSLCRKLGAHYTKEQAARIEQDFVAMNEQEYRARYRSLSKRLAACVVTIAAAVCITALASDGISKARHDAAIVRVL